MRRKTAGEQLRILGRYFQKNVFLFSTDFIEGCLNSFDSVI